MPTRRLKIPLKLAAVALGAALVGCNSNNQPADPNLCPPEYYCSTDAARAFNCTDASPDPFSSDAGTCYPPI